MPCFLRFGLLSLSLSPNLFIVLILVWTTFWGSKSLYPFFPIFPLWFLSPPLELFPVPLPFESLGDPLPLGSLSPPIGFLPASLLFESLFPPLGLFPLPDKVLSFNPLLLGSLPEPVPLPNVVLYFPDPDSPLPILKDEFPSFLEPLAPPLLGNCLLILL